MTEHWTPTLSDRTLAYSESVTDALLGVDTLYREESGDETGLAVLDMSEGRTPTQFEDYEAALDRFADLEEDTESLPEPDRRTYYRQVCASTRAFIEWRTDGLPFRDQVRRFLHVPADPPSDAEVERIRTEIETHLRSLGYDEALPHAVEEWQADRAVAAADVSSVLSSFLDRTRDRVLEAFDLSPAMIPEMDARGVSDAPFNAMCDYANRTVVINTDPTITEPWLLKLAIHEGYPGHVLQFALREGWYDQGVAPADGLLSVVNTASSTTFEGIADSGLQFLGMDETDVTIADLAGRYQTALATIAADRFHRADDSREEIRRYLADNALFGDNGWVDNRVKFLTAPERATLMYSYWHGQPSVSGAFESVPADQRADFFTYLYGRLHSVDTVEMFEDRLAG